MQEAIYNTADTKQSEVFNLNEINDFIFKHEDLDEVIFAGPTNYINKYIQKAKEFELNKYNKNKIKFTIYNED